MKSAKIEIPATTETCEAVIRAMLERVPDQLCSSIATNAALDWTRSASAEEAGSAAFAPFLQRAVKAQESTIKPIIEVWVAENVKPLVAAQAELLMSKIRDMVENAVAPILVDIRAKVAEKADTLSDKMLESFFDRLKEEADRAIVNFGKHLDKEVANAAD